MNITNVAQCQECEKSFNVTISVPTLMGFGFEDDIYQKVTRACPFCGKINRFQSRPKGRRRCFYSEPIRTEDMVETTRDSFPFPPGSEWLEQTDKSRKTTGLQLCCPKHDQRQWYSSWKTINDKEDAEAFSRLNKVSNDVGTQFVHSQTKCVACKRNND